MLRITRLNVTRFLVGLLLTLALTSPAFADRPVKTVDQRNGQCAGMRNAYTQVFGIPGFEHVAAQIAAAMDKAGCTHR